MRINDYGFGRLSPVNFTHMYWEYVDDTNATVLDSVWLVKHSHGPFLAPAAEEEPAEALAARRAHALEAAAAAIREAGGRMTPEAARKLNGERRE